jgi:DNA-binding HxlR family transcriptional regulator
LVCKRDRQIEQVAMREAKSGCPINLTMEVIGDRWSLIVLRDVMFGNRRYFRELLDNSLEGIASNILAARLKRLVELGMMTRAPDGGHKQKTIYSLTEMAIQLVPVMAVIGAWGRRHLDAAPELAIRAQLLEEGGPEMWTAFMEELRHLHLGHRKDDPPPSVLARLTAAYLAMVENTR